MPWGDRTGPWGAGPRTGRGLGYCSGFSAPGFVTAPWGRGRWFWGWRRGWGRGFGRGWWWRMLWAGAYPTDPKTEAEILKEEAEILRRDLEEIEKRLSELEKK